MFGRKKRSGDDARDAGEYDDYAYDDEYDEAEYDDYVEDEDYDEDGYEGPLDEPVHEEPAYRERSYATTRYEDRYENRYQDEDEPDEGARSGPYDFDDVAELLDDVTDQRLDLGSVIVPVPQGGQLQVEMTPDGTPQAVHLATEYGRLTVAAYAAPKSPGQWRMVAADLAESLRNDGAQVSVQTGPWGRELHAVTDGADLRFIGVDGYRWMVRLVAAGPSGAVDEGQPLVAAARSVLGETVVRRGEDPLPVRDPLPVVLPQDLADQLQAAHQQQVQAQQQALAAQAAAAQAHATGTFPAVAPESERPRRGSEGSAMQQLGLN